MICYDADSHATEAQIGADKSSSFWLQRSVDAGQDRQVDLERHSWHSCSLSSTYHIFSAADSRQKSYRPWAKLQLNSSVFQSSFTKRTGFDHSCRSQGYMARIVLLHYREHRYHVGVVPAGCSPLPVLGHFGQRRAPHRRHVCIA